MNHRERFVRTLTGKAVDRVPFIKVFGGTNAIIPGWEKEQPGLSGNIDAILRFEGVYRGWGTTPVNFGLAQRGQPVMLEDNASRSVRRPRSRPCHHGVLYRHGPRDLAPHGAGG